MTTEHILGLLFIFRMGLGAHRVQSSRLRSVLERSRMAMCKKRKGAKSILCIHHLCFLPPSPLGVPLAHQVLLAQCLLMFLEAQKDLLSWMLAVARAATASTRICPYLLMPWVCLLRQSQLPGFATDMSFLLFQWHSLDLNLTAWGPGPLYNFCLSRAHYVLGVRLETWSGLFSLILMATHSLQIKR